MSRPCGVEDDGDAVQGEHVTVGAAERVESGDRPGRVGVRGGAGRVVAASTPQRPPAGGRGRPPGPGTRVVPATDDEFSGRGRVSAYGRGSVRPRGLPEAVPGAPNHPVVSELRGHGQTAVAVVCEHTLIGVLGSLASCVLLQGRWSRRWRTRLPPPRCVLPATTRSRRVWSAERVSITDLRANLLPEDKMTAVRGLAGGGRARGRGGDGVNDALHWPPRTSGSRDTRA